MKTIDQPSSETSSLTRFSCLLTVAALTSTSGLLQAARHPVPTVSMSFEPDDSSSFAPPEGPASQALATTARSDVSTGDMTAIIINLLAKHGLAPDRVSTTGDGSRLLQFFRNRDIEAGVDVFPNGDIVVIIRRDRVSRIYETTANDLQTVPLLLMNAGVAA